jgi:hypothetical protein
VQVGESSPRIFAIDSTCKLGIGIPVATVNVSSLCTNRPVMMKYLSISSLSQQLKGKPNVQSPTINNDFEVQFGC